MVGTFRISDLVELFQKGFARKEQVKGNYVHLSCQGLTEINDHSPPPSSMIDLKLIGIPSSATVTPNFETRLDRFGFHRLPQHQASLKLRHALINALSPWRLSTLAKTTIESFDERTNRILSLWLLGRVVRIFSRANRLQRTLGVSIQI